MEVLPAGFIASVIAPGAWAQQGSSLAQALATEAKTNE
jgi:hypothetical protein